MSIWYPQESFQNLCKSAILPFENTIQNWILQDGPDEYVYDDATWYTTLPRSVRNHSDIHRENVAWANKRDGMAQRMWEDKVGAAVDQVQEIM